MKSRAAYIVVSCLLTAGLAQAGFHHPVEDTGPEAQQIESTPVHPTAVTPSSRRVMPDRLAGPANAPASAAPAAAASSLPVTARAAGAPVAPASVSAAAPAPAAQHPGRQAKLPANVKNSFPSPAIPTYQIPKHAVRAPAKPERDALRAPVPKAPALPAPEHIGVPSVNLPASANRDGLLSMEAPQKLNLKGLNRPQIHAYLKHARELPLPSREYTNEVRSRPITEHYKEALNPVPGKKFRTAYSLNLAKVGKIQEPPALVQYENMVKRIDSLFMGLDLRYARAVANLWQLSESNANPRDLQARDALFAGLISNRAGWNTSASMLFEAAAAKRVERDDRYLKILWQQLESVQDPVLLDKIIAAVSPLRVRDASPAGDRANYAMAKRLLQNPQRVPFQVFPKYETIQQRIGSAELRDKLSLLALVADLRGKDEKRRVAAVGALRALESAGNEDNRQQARLALARTLLQHGEPAEALAFYRNVKKDRKNRLAVLGEQTYAEYVNGEYQDALGKTVALETPYFQFGYAPDVHLVEIMTRKAMCDFGGAEEGVKRFGERYGRELAALDQTLQRKIAPAAFYEELIGYSEKDQPYRYQRFLLQLSSVMENQKTLNQALRELDKLDALGVHQKSLERPEGWDQFAAAMRQHWSDRAAELRRTSGETALAETRYLAERLRHTFAQVELLDLDISTAAAKNYDLQSALNFPANHQEATQVKENQLRWGFDNEIWEDEIDYMRAKNRSKCAQTHTTAAL